LARKITDEHGLDPANLSGSGPGGRILKRDVMKALAGRSDSALDLPEGEPIAKDQRIPLSNMRKTIAKRLLQSKTETPHFYIEMDVDPAPLMELRETLNTRLAEQGQPIKLSLNDFILKATTEALCAVPEVNVSFEGDAIRQHASVHIAFAVTTPGGLLTPVVRNAHKKNLLLIGAEARQLADKAKQGKLTPEEYTGGTFTVSNLGMMGVDRFSAIINPPQAAILAVGATRATPVIDREGRVVPGKRMSLTLSVDHRALDGAQAARYLTELKKSIETPALLLL
jgi:pyruvate dehydrogenase E2 component (dihydrolipoamide acetyltransferase)